MSAADESNVQARVFLTLSNLKIDELSARIESALRLLQSAPSVHTGAA